MHGREYKVATKYPTIRSLKLSGADWSGREKALRRRFGARNAIPSLRHIGYKRVPEWIIE